MKYKIGTKFYRKIGVSGLWYEIKDYLITKNLAGEIVSEKYLTKGRVKYGKYTSDLFTEDFITECLKNSARPS